MKILTTQQLNKAAATPQELVSDGEAGYAAELCYAADYIYENRHTKPVVLISGPSGSGKTTTATRLQQLLREKGCGVSAISMDNYFLPLSKEQLDAGVDFEAPERLDIPLFREHLEKLFRCEEIEIPRFDFAAQDRRKGMPLKRGENDIIILEGIHALNPLVTGESDEFTTCIYVSVRTRLQNDAGELLHPSKIRLMRRLMRDKLYRGRSIEETFEHFKSVERGENLFIMPFKYRADFDIDTFISYGPMVYRDILLPDLRQAAQEYPEYSDYADIERFLEELSSLDRSYIAEDSLIKEFIG